MSQPQHTGDSNPCQHQNGSDDPTPMMGQTPILLPKILIVTANPDLREFATTSLTNHQLQSTSTGTITTVQDELAAGQFDVVLVCDDDRSPEGGLGLVQELHSMTAGQTGAIVLSRAQRLEAAVDAMRAGAIDFVSMPCATQELAARVQAGFERIRRVREQTRRVEQLKGICRKLNSAREEVSEQVGSLCTDLATAYEDLAQQVGSASMVSEFSAIVRQELDVECLLRSTLEYLLSKIGPTNAAVFLPTGHQDFSLGAYVNYDVPKEAADILFDHLADVIPPSFEDDDRLWRFKNEHELRDHLGDDATWLEESDVIVFSCHEDDECIAVVSLFRDRETSYSDEHIEQLQVIRDIFTDQLARVVRIHHRHMPQDHWPGFDVEDESGGLAA